MTQTLQQESAGVPQHTVQAMIEACDQGNLHVAKSLVNESALYAAQQDVVTGQSPLMVAARQGNVGLCQYLLEAGAPWNAIDRQGHCAGNYATDHEHWAVVDLLVEWGTRAELILGQVERDQRMLQQQGQFDNTAVPLEQQSSTKPGYLTHRLQYTVDGKALLDQDRDGVMMEWERPLMQAHAQVLMGGDDSAAPLGDSQPTRRSVLNVGFGMGIIDGFIQEYDPALHIIIEAHPDVHRKMLADGWHEKSNVRLCLGKWQNVLPQLVQEGIQVDAIFYDTYAEHYTDMQDFHEQMLPLLRQPHGIYSFFNGLAPDNLFFHGVACQCVKLQLAQLGLDTEFCNCEIPVPHGAAWKDVRRKYWHGRDTYYLPICRWIDDGEQQLVGDEKGKNKKQSDADDTCMDVVDDNDTGKRQKTV